MTIPPDEALDAMDRALSAARAILGEAGHVDGLVLLAEIDGRGTTVIYDDDMDSLPQALELINSAAQAASSDEWKRHG